MWPRMKSIVFGVLVVAGCNSEVKPASPPPTAPRTVVAPVARASTSPVTVANTARAELEAALGFEATTLGRWTSHSDPAIALDTAVVHGGHGSVRIERSPTTPDEFSTIVDGLPIDFSGSTVELRGFVRTDDVRGGAALWLREDSESSQVQFVNSQDHNVAGTTGWTEVSVQLPLDNDATKLVWGVLLEGSGKAWADDLQLLVDGKPIWEAPYVTRQPSAIGRDHQFEHGSGVSITQLTPPQIENLALLGRVWGFLKYHHPKVTAGQLHWDYELLRVLPTILAATDRATAELALLHWIDGLGPVAPCHPCATLDEGDVALRPDLAWLDTVGPELSKRLHAIYDARTPGQQFYVSMVLGAGNPKFQHELGYEELKLPDAGFQLLALFRLWNAVEYWAPDRALANHWDAALTALIPTVTLAGTKTDYTLAMMAAIAEVHDTHANLWSSLDVRPPVGACELPIGVRFVGRRPVVATADPDHKLAPGDVITSIDGASIDSLFAQWTPYYAASNEPTRLRDIAASMTRGACGEVSLVVDRGGKSLRLKLPRATPASQKPKRHDLSGPAFRLLSPEVAYLKLSAFKQGDVAHYVEQAAGTKGWIVDIRNYPSEFAVFALGSLLVDAPTPFARFTVGDLSNPGAFHWNDPISLEPATPHYGGKIVVLVDEVSQSQAEYTAMALRAAPRTIVVGSTTAGADGNISDFALPGGLSTVFSGLGVFYPDKRPTQVVGIVPDVTVTPTIAGLRAGRDEVLEAGIRAILGKTASSAQIERIVRTARSAE
jgi:C-terminal processing protease CtpA/Prc